MRDLPHGPAVPAFGSAGRAAAIGLLLIVGGCRPDKGGGPASRPAEEPLPEPLPPPRLTSEVVGRRAMPPPPALSELRPASVLAPGERRAVFPLASPALLRVERREGRNLVRVAEAEGGRGQIVVIDRRTGVTLDGGRLAEGPLEAAASYELYVLPPGGVVNEATVTRVRPETEQERRDRAEAEKAAKQAAEQPATRPATRPGA